jgi:hypothetical protein
MRSLRRYILFAAICLAPPAAWATKPKLDPDTCTSLRLEQIKFRQSGILDDMSKGAAWAKANLSADRIREIQHYLELDEQVRFGCRDAKLSDEAKRASEAAARIEINSDADPTLPVAKDPPKPGAMSDKAADKHGSPKKAVKKKKKAAKTSGENDSKADVAPPPVIVQSQPEAGSSEAPASASAFAGTSGSQAPPAPAMGFNGNGGEVLPWSSP